MKKNTSITITKEDKEKLQKIEDLFSINKSAAIRISINALLSNLYQVERFLETNKKEVRDTTIHFQINTELLNRVDTLAELNDTNRSKIISAAIRAFDSINLNDLSLYLHTC